MRGQGPWVPKWRKNKPGSAKPWRKVWQSNSPKSIGKRAIKLAKKDVGYHESPAGSNKTKYGEYWKQDGVPWCGMATAYWWKFAGAFVPRELALKIDYVPELIQLAKQGKYGLRIVTKSGVYPGVAAAYDFDGGAADHVGLFYKWVDKSRGIFLAIEGNTSVGNDSNGGSVMIRERNVNQVEAFVAKLR